MTPEELVEIETIKQLKARYCRYLDTKDWAAWRTIFADDFLSDTSQAGGKVIEGADEFVAFTRKSLRNQATVHQVHAPEIEADVGDDRARNLGARGRGAIRARREPARVRALPRDLRKGRRASGASRAPS